MGWNSAYGRTHAMLALSTLDLEPASYCLLQENWRGFRRVWQPIFDADIENWGCSAKKTLTRGWGDKSSSSSCDVCKRVPPVMGCFSVRSQSTYLHICLWTLIAQPLLTWSSLLLSFNHCNFQVYILLLLNNKVSILFPVLIDPLVGNIWHFPQGNHFSIKWPSL